MAQRFNPSTGLIEHFVIPKDGIQGPMGFRGEVGPAGKDGSMGPMGLRGIPGESGKDGRDGKDGEPGPEGKRGPIGPAGKDGQDGIGTPGTNGSIIFRTAKKPDDKLGVPGDWAFTALNEIWFREPKGWVFFQQIGGGFTGRISHLEKSIIKREVYSISTNTTLRSDKSRDYFYFVSGTTTITMPTAIGNLNRYSVKNVGSGIVTVASSDTIDGVTSFEIRTQYESVDMISTGTVWAVI